MTLGNWNGYHSYKRREGGGSTSLVKLQYCTEALQLQMGPNSDDWNVQKIPFEIGYWWPFMRRQIHWVWLCINVNFRPHAHKWGTHTAHSIAEESPSPSSSSSPSSSLSSQMRDWRGTVQIPCSMNRRLKTGQDCQKNQNLDLNKAVFPEDFLYEIDHQLWSEQPNNKCKFNWLLWMILS